MGKLQEAKRLHALELSLPGNDAGPRVLLSMLSPLQTGFLFTKWKMYVVILDKCRQFFEVFPFGGFLTWIARLLQIAIFQ